MPKHVFTVIIERQPEGEYVVSVPSLPGCPTEGRTLEEARTMAADAVRAHCASLLRHGEPIPVESANQRYVGHLRVALELDHHALGSEHPTVADRPNSQGSVLREMGDRETARA